VNLLVGGFVVEVRGVPEGEEEAFYGLRRVELGLGVWEKGMGTDSVG
jgi:hypothetical protein